MRQFEGFLDRQSFDPAKGAEQRQNARCNAKAVHLGESVFYGVEGFLQRLLATTGLEDLDAVGISNDPGLALALAQRIDQGSGLPMGMHVDGHDEISLSWIDRPTLRLEA